MVSLSLPAMIATYTVPLGVMSQGDAEKKKSNLVALDNVPLLDAILWVDPLWDRNMTRADTLSFETVHRKGRLVSLWSKLRRIQTHPANPHNIFPLTTRDCN